MRHLKHHFQLSVKQEHRKSLMANLVSQLFLHERIKTTLIKAKALRPLPNALSPWLVGEARAKIALSSSGDCAHP